MKKNDLDRIYQIRDAASSGKRLKPIELTEVRSDVGHRNWAVRCTALEILIQLQSPSDAVRILLATYDPNWSVRCEAIEALPDFLGRRAKRRLLELCQNEPHPINKGVAIQALGYAIGADALPFLHSLAGTRMANQTKLRLLDALVRLGEQDQLNSIIEFLTAKDRLSRELCLNLVGYQVEDGTTSAIDLLEFEGPIRAFLEVENNERLCEKGSRILQHLSR